MSNHKDGRYTNGTRITLRLPVDIKRQIVDQLPDGMSQNDFIIEALREKLAQSKQEG